MTLPAISYACGTWSLTLGEEHRAAQIWCARLPGQQNFVRWRRVLVGASFRLFGAKNLELAVREQEETGDNCIMRNFMICSGRQMLLGG